MDLTLYVPGLLLPIEILDSTTYDLTAPTLSGLLGRGVRQEMPGGRPDNLFGLDALPSAALRKVGAGGTATGEWLCLDPVRWQVSPEGVMLDDPALLELDAAESEALLDAIRALFVDWGESSTSAPGRWEVRLKKPVALETQPLHEAIHQAIDPALPGGADGPAWRRLLAEAQTVLHAHPVNRRREEEGRPTVNSLWVWGQGSLPDKMSAGFSAVWSKDPVVAGLCVHAAVPCLDLPERFLPANGHVLAIVDHLTTPARTLDALAWREALLAFERDWLALAVTTCQSLRLIGTRCGHPPSTVAFEMKRGDRLRFWRKPRPLTELK